MNNLSVFTNESGLKGLKDENNNIILKPIFEKLIYDEEYEIFCFKIKADDKISNINFNLFHKNGILEVSEYGGKYKEDSIHYFIKDFKIISSKIKVR